MFGCDLEGLDLEPVTAPHQEAPIKQIKPKNNVRKPRNNGDPQRLAVRNNTKFKQSLLEPHETAWMSVMESDAGFLVGQQSEESNQEKVVKPEPAQKYYPAPYCSCTGTNQQCYRWGNGGWQSACCTTKISMYPLPMNPKKKGSRVAGRKMSAGAFRKLIDRLSAEGVDVGCSVDLRPHWAKHGTNRCGLSFTHFGLFLKECTETYDLGMNKLEDLQSKQNKISLDEIFSGSDIMEAS